MTVGKQHEKPVYVRLRETIADAILAGRYGDGDPLPSVRALAAEEQANPLTVAEAARLILSGEPVAVPTETVYGLAADATNAAAVARVYEAKGRPAFNPLIVHVIDLAAAERIGDFSDAARRFAKRHWPGPLTL